MKTILVLDEMPDNCYKCRFFDFFEGCIALGEQVYFDEAWEEYYPVRDYRCPLKPLPEKKVPVFDPNDCDIEKEKQIIYEIEGYNRCVDEILREEDNNESDNSI